MKKRWTALACTLCLCASLTLPAAAAGGYTDVPGGAWYESAVNEVTEKGYMTGVSESQFAPTANVTRATVVTVLWRMEVRRPPRPPSPLGTCPPRRGMPSRWPGPRRTELPTATAGGTSSRINPSHARSWRPSSPALTNTGAYRWPRLPQPVLRRNMTGVWAVESMRHAVGMGWLEGDGGKLLPGGVATRPSWRDPPAPHHPGHG